ncbi:hypothetical protein BKA65DRAFT_546257 [Rhexocercosporidium sp. MPI-PUGE-AT-0058]|nr:hypothetical protein BKA65DRAFT_546257 [Rhexocercosporidium sp. MPI-PUGE-AT-0058]
MANHQQSAAKAYSQTSSNEVVDFRDRSSHSGSENNIDSRATSASQSTTRDRYVEEDLNKLHLDDEPSTASSSSSSSSSSSQSSTGADADADDNAELDTEAELFQDAPPIVANSAEIQEFSRLAEELSLFASCIASSPSPAPSPPALTSTNSPSLQITSSPTPTSTSLPDPLKTPTQASASEAERQRSQAQALISQRKEELKRDLMELIQEEEEGPNRDLITSIDRLMRDWKRVHEGFERWRRELKGERVRKMYRREMEE